MIPELSIIIPAYNEEAVIGSTLDCLQIYLSARPESYEIIVVDDGSQDKTVGSVQQSQKNNDSIRLLINEKNMGKGSSIQRGVLESRGQFVLFTDADLPYELDAIDGFLKALRDTCDLAVGSRVLPGSQVK